MKSSPSPLRFASALAGLCGVIACSPPASPPSDAAAPPAVSAAAPPKGATDVSVPASPASVVDAYPPLARALSATSPDSLARPRVRFSRDGRRLLVCCSRGATPSAPASPLGAPWWIHVWDLEQGKLAGSIPHTPEHGGGEAAPFVEWSPGGRYIVTYDSLRLRLFHADTLRPARDVLADYGVHAIDPDDRRLVWSRTNEDAFLVDLTTGKSLARRVTGNAATGLLVDLDWSPTGAHALVDGLFWRQDGAEVGRWEKATGQPWPGDEPLGWTWTPDGALLLVAAKGRLTAIDLSKGRAAWSVDGVEPPIATDPAGAELVYVTPSGAIAALRLADRKPVATFTQAPRPPDPARGPSRYDDDAIRFSADGAWFVVQRTFEPLRVCGTRDHTCAELPWTTARNAAVPRFRGADLYVQTTSAIVAWSPDASRRWRLDTPERAGFDVSADGRFFAAAASGAAVIVRLGDRRVVPLSARLDGAAWIASLAPDEAAVLRP